MNDKTITSVDILGRRWFRKSAGNTYNTAAVTLTFSDGSSESFKTPVQYGYGEQYHYIAANELERRGYMPGREHYNNGGAQPAWQYFREDRGIPCNYRAVDVQRKRDL